MLVWACRAVAFLTPLIAYLVTIAPAVQPGDSAELTTAVATLGVPHSPGYPVYVLVTHPFTWLPVGDVGFRVNIASAVYAALCVLLLFETLVAMRVRIAPALVASQFAAFSYYFWSGALIAEVYTFDVLLLIALLRSVVGFRRTGATAWLAAAGLVAGLGIANRSGFMLFAPLLLLVAVPGAPRPSFRQTAIATALLTAGLSVYAFVPLRAGDDSAYIWGTRYLADGTQVRPDLTSPGALWDFFTLKPFRWLFFLDSRSAYSREVWTTATWAWAAFLGGGTLLGGIGLAQAWRTRRFDVLAAGALAVAYAAALAGYSAPDTEQMFLPFIVLWAIPAGVGLAALWDSSTLRVCVSACVGILVVLNFPLADHSGASAPRDDGMQVLRSVENDAIIIGLWPEMAVMEYLQQVEGERRDVRLVQLWSAGPVLAREMIDSSRGSRPVYIQLLDPAAGTPEGAQLFMPGWVVFDAAEARGGDR